MYNEYFLWMRSIPVWIRSTVAKWLGTVSLPCVYLKPTMMVSIGKLLPVPYVRTPNHIYLSTLLLVSIFLWEK